MLVPIHIPMHMYMYCACILKVHSKEDAHMLDTKRVMRSGGTWSNTGFCTWTLDTRSPSLKLRMLCGDTILLNVSCTESEGVHSSGVVYTHVYVYILGWTKPSCLWRCPRFSGDLNIEGYSLIIIVIRIWIECTPTRMWCGVVC